MKYIVFLIASLLSFQLHASLVSLTLDKKIDFEYNSLEQTTRSLNGLNKSGSLTFHDDRISSWEDDLSAVTEIEVSSFYSSPLKDSIIEQLFTIPNTTREYSNFNFAVHNHPSGYYETLSYSYYVTKFDESLNQSWSYSAFLNFGAPQYFITNDNFAGVFGKSHGFYTITSEELSEFLEFALKSKIEFDYSEKYVHYDETTLLPTEELSWTGSALISAINGGDKSYLSVPSPPSIALILIGLLISLRRSKRGY